MPPHHQPKRSELNLNQIPPITSLRKIGVFSEARWEPSYKGVLVLKFVAKFFADLQKGNSKGALRECVGG